jgi:hypothetical protein
LIRHCVEESNVDEELNVVDATKIRHVTVKAGKIESMSGLIDPASHLNLDFPDHRVTICVIAEKFAVGANVKMDDDGLLFATVQRSSYAHYGPVDYTQRLVGMINAVKRKNPSPPAPAATITTGVSSPRSLEQEGVTSK